MFTKVTVRGGNQYVGVDERLRWARYEHPDLQQTSEQIVRSDEYAEFRVTLVISSSGARAEGHGDCYKADFSKFVQKAEENALGNALGHLGYSSEAAISFEKRRAGTKPGTESKE
jgi:hypothetical protein